MKTTMLFLASLLAIIPAFTDSASTDGSLPDLCDDVHLDADGVPIHDSTGMTLSRYCEWSGPDAPWWGAAVCCSFDAAGAHCTAAPSRDGCAAGESEMWCDHGAEDTADGSVTCYQPFPDACDLGICDDAPAGTATGDMVPVCCLAGHGCWEVDIDESCEMGAFSWCDDPYTKEDGTVGCDGN